jgi:hypothetical protein
MSLKSNLYGVLAFGLSALMADACTLTVRVACPNNTAAAGIKVWVSSPNGDYPGVTDGLGIVEIPVPGFDTYTVCVDESTLPAGATLVGRNCQRIKVISDAPPVVDFELGGSFCSTPPPPGPCWLTGGGTIDKTRNTPNYTFGGVVYPGCSPKAADGGNWNVVDHYTGLHFLGRRIIVDSCSGVPTSSPKVTVNVIDFHGEGVIMPNGGDGSVQIPVTFVGRAVDNKEGGAGADMLFIKVNNGAATVLQIGASAADPAIISTGNLQIHQTSCNN